MERFRYPFLLFALAASLTLSACKEEPLTADIALQSDLSGIVAALDEMGASLSDKLAAIEAAVDAGLADNLEASKQIQAAVAALGGTAEEKLAAIASVVKGQGTSLEAKLSLIEAAFNGGFADANAQQSLLQEAVASLEGSLDEKFSALETAVKTHSTSLEAKLGLIAAAVTERFADCAAVQALIVEAIESSGSTLEEKAAAIEAAVGSQTADLSARLALIETAVQQGFAADTAQQSLIRTAVDSLRGNAEEKFAAIETAVQSQTVSLGTKLDLIEAAVGGGASGGRLDLIRKALVGLGGTVAEKLAAIDTVVTEESTELATKIELIAAALGAGFLDETEAVRTAQTALATSLDSLDASIAQVGDEIVAQLDTLASQMTPEELAKAFQGIRAAIINQTQSTTGLLAALQRALVELEEAIVPFRLNYLGEPTLMTAAGGSWRADIQVNPANTVIDEAKLKLDILSRKQFFPTWGNNAQGDASSILYSLSLTADPSVEGKYAVTISCQCPYVVWDEVTVALSAAYGSTQKPGYASTEPFDLVMTPKALKGLKYWTYPAASFTFKRHGSINNIYYSLDSGVFNTQDQSDTRTYTAAFIDSVQFIPVNDSIAPVFIQLDKEKRMIVFIPDTAGITYTQFWPDKDPSDRGGWRLWHNFKDSSGVKHESLMGKLVLTDRWHVKDTIHNFKIGWYNAVWFPERAIVGVNDIQDDNTAVVDTRSLLSKLGLERAWLEGRYILQEHYGDLEGPYLKMSAQLLPETLKLAVKFQGDPAAGSIFGLTAHYDLWTFPTETDPQFKILALSFSYSLVVTIVD